jgi:AcrR family transcriptional regulator
LQDAFVHVLLERGYAGTTVREVAEVAGVAIGTFYAYFGNMKALAAICIHRVVAQAAKDARHAVDDVKGESLDVVAGALLNSQLRSVMADPKTWAALYLLERQVSSPAAFRKHYEEWVELWQHAISIAADPLPAERLQTVARMAHVMTYSWLAQCLLTVGPDVNQQWLRNELHTAVQAYLSVSREGG